MQEFLDPLVENPELISWLFDQTETLAESGHDMFYGIVSDASETSEKVVKSAAEQPIPWENAPNQYNVTTSASTAVNLGAVAGASKGAINRLQSKYNPYSRHEPLSPDRGYGNRVIDVSETTSGEAPEPVASATLLVDQGDESSDARPRDRSALGVSVHLGLAMIPPED